MNGLLNELRRRNVIRMAGLYLVGAWLMAQISETLLPIFHTPEWVLQTLVVLLAIGFIPALIFSWVFELTPDGLKRDADVPPEKSIAPQTARRMERLIIILFALALVFFGFDKFVLAPKREAALVQETTAAVQAVAETEAQDEAQQGVLANSIAVLPFVNMSEDKDNQYFSDGISEELLNVLVDIEFLSVASRTSSFAYRDQKLSAAEIARELKVGHILEGSVRKSGNTVRITAQLIDASNDRHVWSETYDRELTDIFAIQDEIANAIVTALRGSLGEVEGDAAVRVKADTENMQAYDLYLKARELFISRSDITESVRLFELAVAQDPNFARGWEGLAAVASIAKSWGIDDRDYDAMVEPAAQRALDLDPSLSMAWAAKAQLESNREHADWAKALDFNDRAIEADPKNATAFLWRSIVWLNLGFFDRAFTDLETCLSIDPAYQNCTRWKAQALLYVGDEEQALAMYERGVARGFVRNRAVNFVPALVRTGNTLAARLILDLAEVPAEFGEILLAALANPQAPTPDPKAIVARFEFSNSGLGAALGLAEAYLWLGAFDAVAEAAYGLGSDALLPWMRAHPGWRNSAGFKKVLELTGVTSYWKSHGYPPQCRAVGDDDFTCDQAVP